MKQKLSIWLAVLMCICTVFLAVPLDTQAVTHTPTRVINLVYDDSGSMIVTDGKEVDTWCQAKYAMEVFAAMLGQNDSMNVYVMSDYVSGTSAPPRITLKGSDGPDTNVSKIHNMLTNASDTPFNSVRKAYADLQGATADEKWLVVLTDGAFQGIGGQKEIEAFLGQKDADIRVMFLSMGAKADVISANEGNNIYSEKASTNDQILNKITGICTRVFNSDRLDIKSKTYDFTFDVPMGELIVFAQGEKVNISGIEDSEGNLIKPNKNPVSVRYSEKAATNYTGKGIVADNLVGSIATFQGDFAEGDYKVKVTGAETVEVYYKPNVEIAAFLIDKDGNEVTDLADLEADTYTIEFCFVKGGTDEKIEESKILGDVSYEATVTNNGVTHEKKYKSGDKIELEEGSLTIEALARYLEYNTVSTTLEYTIFKNKEISFDVEKNPKYYVHSKGLTTDKKDKEKLDPIVIRMTIDGRDFTAEEWGQLALPEVKLLEKEKGDSFLDIFRTFNTVDSLTAEKAEEPGVLYLYPAIENDNPKGGSYVNTSYSLKVRTEINKAKWSGDMEDKVDLSDTRSLFEREGGTIIKLAITFAITFLLLGFTPIFKKRFPRSMKSNPTITCKPVPFGKMTTAHGRFKKDTASTLLPFVAETGSLRFVPSGTVGVPAMKLKAGGGSKMIVVNTTAFAGKGDITIDGMAVPEGQNKPLQKSPNMMIDVKTQSMKYSCVPRN